jgi:BolA protein
MHPTMAPTSQDIHNALQLAFPDSAIAVQDDSHLHAGHAGAREGRHFSVRIISPRFIELNRVSRHRLVYDALADEFKQGIHALAIEAWSPAEAAKQPASPSQGHASQQGSP